MSPDDRSDASGAGGAAGRFAEELSNAPRPLTIACGVIALEALALAGLAVFLVFDTLAGKSDRAGFGLLSALFALLGAAVLFFGARGLIRLSPSARTPIVVLEVLALPVAYTMAFQAELVSVGGPIFVAALTVLYLLFTPPVRAVLDRERD